MYKILGFRPSFTNLVGENTYIVSELAVGSGELDKRTLNSVPYDFVNHDYVFFVKTHH